MLFLEQPFGFDDDMKDFSCYEEKLCLLDDIDISVMDEDIPNIEFEFEPKFKKQQKINIRHVNTSRKK